MCNCAVELLSSLFSIFWDADVPPVMRIDKSWQPSFS